MSKPLIGFHETIQREVISFDALWILGTGLGLKPLLQHIIEQYASHKELVIVLNIDPTRFDPIFAEQHPLIVAEGITAAQRYKYPQQELLRSFLDDSSNFALFLILPFNRHSPLS